MKKNKKTMKCENKGLNKMVYQGDEMPEGGVKVPIQNLKVLVDEGEKLAVMLAEQMVNYGYSYYGSFIKTYALTQMVAYMKVFAADRGFDIMAMFEAMMPSFTREAQLMLEDIKAEKRQRDTGFKFLELDNKTDAKVFKGILKNLDNE